MKELINYKILLSFFKNNIFISKLCLRENIFTNKRNLLFISNLSSLKLFYLFLTITFHGIAQSDEPWSMFAGAQWTSNSNMTQIYTLSTSWTAYTSTTQASIGNPTAACDATATNDQWLRIPHNGCDNIRVIVNWENTNTAASRTVRYAVYRGSSCTSSSCPLTLLTSQCFTTGTTSACFGNALVTRTSDVSYSAGEFIFVRLWDENNSTSSRPNVYAICGTSNTPSTPTNENCATPTFITNGGCPGTNWTAPSGGFAVLGSLTDCSWGVNENPVFYEFIANSSSMTISIDGVNCLAPACNGDGSALQFAVYPSTSPCTSISASSRMPTSANASECFEGQGSIGGVFTGFTVGNRYLIAIDGLNGARCSWSGITVSGAANLQTATTSVANICAGSSTSLSIPLNSGQTVTWTASPADPSLTSPNANPTTVSPTQNTTYTATVNLGAGKLCNGNNANSYTSTINVNVLNPNAVRLGPLGPQCSGSTLNFEATPSGGTGVYSYAWSTSPASSSSSISTFSPTLTNNGCIDASYTVSVNVTSGSLTCSRSFTPLIRPIPSLTGNPPVDCAAANVDLNNANINACAGCTGCTYTLTSCIGCSGASDPVGTSNTTGDFTLNGASSATFTVTTPPSGINTGCVSAPTSYDFLLPPFDCVSPLPVELAEFNVQCEDNQNVFSWYVFNEIDNDYFTIQKSRDGVNYVTLDQIQSQLNSNAYVYHEQMPENGEFYYRILQTDLNGLNSVLSTISHSFPCVDNEKIDIYPNPTLENTFVTISTKESNVKIEVLNSLGQIVIDELDYQFKQKETKVFALNTEFLSDGIYMIKVSIDEKMYIKKLVKE